jgi:hypothetical protein
VAVRANEKRLYVERQYERHTSGVYATFLAALQAAAFLVADANKSGTPSSITAGDRSTSFSNSDHGSTPSDMADMWGELLDLYDISLAALISSGIASPTDLQIKTEMLDRLRPVRSVRSSYVNLRAA